MKHRRSARSVSCILAALLLLGSCASGSGEGEDNGNQMGQSQNPTGTVDSAENASDADEIDFSSLSFIDRVKHANSAVEDNLPAADYGGKDLLIYHHYPELLPEEVTGELVNDAQFAQKLAVEERFNVRIRCSQTEFNSWDPYVAGVQSLFMAGDHFTDLFSNWNTSTAGFTSQGFFVDLSQFDVIDTTKPWYFGDEMDLYSANGRIYLATGTMDVDSMAGRISAVYFNKQVRADYGLDNFYEVVREGRWTLDYVKETAGSFYHDLNGNSERDNDNLYGLSYAAAGSWMVTPATLGIPQIRKDADGVPVLTVVADAERAETVMDSMKELTNMDGARSISDWDTEIFDEGHALFAVYELGKLTALRDGIVDYGILPTWKADEAQEAYYASYLPDPWAIAICAEDKDMCAVLLTALAAEGFKQVLPAYYENAIKSKYSTDEESGEMLDLMLNNVRSDGMFLYGDSGYIYNLWQYMISPQGFASYWKSKQKMMEKTMNAIMEKLDALEGE